jgi:hypothetical protein
MGEFVDVLAQEIFVRRAAREAIEPGGADVEQRAEALAKLCYQLAEGFILHARSRAEGGTTASDAKAH